MSESSSRVLRAEAALVAVAAVWGLTFVTVKDAVESVSVSAFLAYRFLAATALVALIAYADVRRLTRHGWLAGIAMGALLTAGYAFQTAGLQYTSASKAGFITGLFVVLTPLFHALVPGGKKASLTVWGAALMATLGLWLMTELEGAAGKGDVLVFFCACSFALHILVTNWAVGRHAVGALVVVQLGVCGLASLIYGAGTGQLNVAITGELVWALILTAVFASAIGFVVQTYAQRHVPPARTALVLASEPAFAGLFGFLLAGDRLGLRGWAGAVIISGAILWSVLAAEPEPVLVP